jgi:hypothetical protein
MRRPVTRERVCERSRVGGKPKREPRYRYRAGSLHCRRVIGRTVRRARGEKILGRAEMARVLSAFVGVVYNRRCLLRGRVYLRLPGSPTPSDRGIPKCSIDASRRCRGSRCSLERSVFSGKGFESHFRLFDVLFSCRNRLLVLSQSIRPSCGVRFRFLCDLFGLRERLGIPGLATK